MSDADCTPGREPRSVAASFKLNFLSPLGPVHIVVQWFLPTRPVDTGARYILPVFTAYQHNQSVFTGGQKTCTPANADRVHG